jgi:hypothetical protein
MRWWCLLCTRPTCLVGFLVLVPWNNSRRIDMSPHSTHYSDSVPTSLCSFSLNAWKMWFHLVCRCILPLCSIYSNSSHVGWLVGSSDTSVKVDIQANFDWNKQCFTEDLNSLCWVDGHRQKVMTKAQITLFELKSK